MGNNKDADICELLSNFLNSPNFQYGGFDPTINTVVVNVETLSKQSLKDIFKGVFSGKNKKPHDFKSNNDGMDK